jgi:phosphoribosyl-AMP cyclohydrolase
MMINLDFKKQGGLIPVVAQDYKSLLVLMVAYMNEDAWNKTLETGIVHYYSRSRNKLWKKGESSGNIQEVKEIRIDCDNDTILIKVNQVGDAACHTGYRSCFYSLVKGESVVTSGDKIFDPKEKYGDAK